MERLYNRVLRKLEVTLRILEGRVLAPRRVPYKDSFVFRYDEKTLHQALIQKLARVLSGLRAARLLMAYGFVQEQGSLQRMLDELDEDIQFLAFAVIFNRFTALHQAYLDAFYEEEFDAETALESTQKRPMIPRRKIRAYLANIDVAPLDPSKTIEVSRTVHKVYSGYVHAASPHAMELYGGKPPHFHTRGIPGTSLHQDHRDDLRNYFYRGILSFVFCAKAFGDEALFQLLRNLSLEFERLAGEDLIFPLRAK